MFSLQTLANNAARQATRRAHSFKSTHIIDVSTRAASEVPALRKKRDGRVIQTGKGALAYLDSYKIGMGLRRAIGKKQIY